MLLSRSTKNKLRCGAEDLTALQVVRANFRSEFENITKCVTKFGVYVGSSLYIFSIEMQKTHDDINLTTIRNIYESGGKTKALE